jgi:hypothetical protein
MSKSDGGGLTRRQVATLAAIAPTLAAERVFAQNSTDDGPDYPHYDAQPDDVEIVFDEATLKQYRPLLKLSPEAERSNLLGIHGLVAQPTADAEDPPDTIVCVYWVEWATQDGVSPFESGPLSDSHHGDHEPIYVFVDRSDGSVSLILFSAYHWIRGVDPAPALYNDTHPQLYVFAPHHHYRRTEQEGIFPDLYDLTDSYPDWLANGLAEAMRPGAVTNPWSMRNHESWWRSSEAAGLVEVNVAETVWQTLRSVGYGDAG